MNFVLYYVIIVTRIFRLH